VPLHRGVGSIWQGARFIAEDVHNPGVDAPVGDHQAVQSDESDGCDVPGGAEDGEEEGGHLLKQRV
jgi:hypothetical protein